ncbi:lipoprotein, putative [Xanthomonas campestris pv. raphani 756C]|nr:lipoprotein, putative [Xanthomonas campestris pv. raphani 756C]
MQRSAAAFVEISSCRTSCVVCLAVSCPLLNCWIALCAVFAVVALHRGRRV